MKNLERFFLWLPVKAQGFTVIKRLVAVIALGLVGLVGATALHAASTIQFTATAYDVAENAGTATITVQRQGDTNSVVGVDYASMNRTATAGADYTNVSGTLTFAAGETNQSFTVPVLNDSLVEPLEIFQVILSNSTGGAVLGSRTTATVRITDNDTGPAFEFANYWAREDEGSVLIGVARSGDSHFPITVDVISADGTAKAGLDYIGITNTLSFAAGEKLKLFTIPILNDGLKEANETFRLSLVNATGVVLGSTRAATVLILDNDPGVQFTASELWVQETEAAVQLTVTRGNDVELDAFTVDYTTANGTATAGSDYTETKGTLAFGAGEMTKSFAVPILNDGVAEKDEQFKVVLSNPTGGMLLGATSNITATVTVCDVREMLPHRFEAVHVSPEGMVSLTLGGGFTPGLGISNRFQPYFDIYPVEVSTNLVDWTPLTWLVRTNASTNQLTFIDPNANAFSQRFYRTAATAFVAPQRVPSGQYPVGIMHRTIKDDTRRNRYRISTNGSFPITIWYPAKRLPEQWPAAYDLEPIARDPRPGAEWEGWIDRVPYFHSYSVRNAPFAAGLAGLPVVLWSHGGFDYRNDCSELAEDLASHGYVVLGVDHFDSSYVVYSDGTYLFTDSRDAIGRDIVGTQSVLFLNDRVRDFVVILDEMASWNQNDNFFLDRLDVQNVAVMGWSYGGGAAAEFCRVDARGKAAVVLEGYFQGADALLAAGLSKPVLSMYQSQTGSNNMDLFNKLKQDAVWFQIRDTEHFTFGTWYWWPTSKPLDRSREAARTITGYTLWFLNKHLKGSMNPMPPPANYPQVFNFKQK